MIVRRLLQRTEAHWNERVLLPLSEPDVKVRRPAKTNLDHFVEEPRVVQGVSLRDVDKRWWRLVRPIDAVKGAQPGMASWLSNLRSVLFEGEGPGVVTDMEPPVEQVVATFGHALHDRPSASTGPSATGCIFEPVLPHPASLISVKTEGDPDLSEHTEVILKFDKVSSASPTTRQVASQLCLRLKVSSSSDLTRVQIPQTFALQHVFPWREVVAPLPSNDIDVRLTRTFTIPAMEARGSLGDFEAGNTINILAGNLTPPGKVSLILPEHRLESGARVSEYDFTGLEVHRVVQMPWRHHTLRYTSIDAGYNGGHRQELTLIAANRTAGTSETEEDDTATDFLQLVEETAMGKHFSWEEGYKSMNKVPEEDLDVQEDPNP
jgi:hypothetical protein